jgi:hypothetical protein
MSMSMLSDLQTRRLGRSSWGKTWDPMWNDSIKRRQISSENLDT